MKRFVKIVALILSLMLLCGCGRDALAQDLHRQLEQLPAMGELARMDAREQIQVLRYIPAGTAEPVTLEQLPVTQEQWQAITQALAQLPLEAERTSLLAKLFPKRDGGDYRRLTLICGEKAVAYRWPAQGAQLEQLLEQLVEEVTG